MSQDNLLAMVREAKLVDTWKRTRTTWVLKLIDAVRELMGPPPPRVYLERGMVEMLKGSLWAVVEEGTSVRFTVRWRDPTDAYNLTEIACRNFFAGRRSEQYGAMERAISLLDLQLKQADEKVDPAVREMQETVQRSRAKMATRAAAPGAELGAAAGRSGLAAGTRANALTPVPPRDPAVSTDALKELRAAAREIAEPWQRRQADLSFQLAELRTIFGPAHPLVTQQEAKVAAASQVPPELARLRAEEEAVLAQLSALATSGSAGPTPRRNTLAGTGQSTSTSAGGVTFNLEQQEDPEVAAARAKVESALGKVKELSQRLDSARLELATAEAGEKYRTSVVEAAEVSRKPIKPKRALLVAAAIGVSLVLGLLAGAVRELLGGRVLEAWQVRRLGLDVLGELELPE